MSKIENELPETLPRWKIPSGWRWISIGEVGKIVTGNTPSTKDRANYGNDIPFVKPPELIDKGIRSAADSLSTKGTQSARVLPAGAVLVSCIGGLGKTGLVKVPIAFNQQINAVIFDERVLPEFGFYYAQTLKEWLYGVASATTLPIVNKGKFQRAPFPLAPLSAQKRIVAEIEKQFSRLDEAVANLKRVKANLKRYKAAVLKAAVEGKLIPTEAELARHEGRAYETGAQLLERILTERRQKWQGRSQYKEPVIPDRGSLSELPKGWGLASLEAIADVIDPNPSHRMPKYVPDGIPLMSSENFVGTEGIDFSIGKQVARETLKQQRSRYTIDDGDFVLSRIGTIGKTRFLPTKREYCLSHALVVLKVRSKSINKRWLRKTIESESILSQARKGVQSVGVPDLGMAKIREFAIPLPPLAEQQRIVAEVERRLSVVEELEAVVNANLQRATRLHQSTLQKAFTGQL